jgi:hypothetical protein
MLPKGDRWYHIVHRVRSAQHRCEAHLLHAPPVLRRPWAGSLPLRQRIADRESRIADRESTSTLTLWNADRNPALEARSQTQHSHPPLFLKQWVQIRDVDKFRSSYRNTEVAM